MQLGTVALILIGLNIFLSIKGFKDNAFFNSWLFRPDAVLKNREYHRLITAGFLHVSFTHLLFNMLTLFFFAGMVEQKWGSLMFAILYLTSLIGGNLLSLLIHRNNPSYLAVGASGAVSGVLFAAIALSPDMSLYLFFIPIPIPAWVVGIGFVIYSIYGIYSQRDNIGHEAHLGGAVLGILLSMLIVPGVLEENFLTVGLILIPVVVFILIMLFMPQLIMKGSGNPYEIKYTNIDDQYHHKRSAEQREMDELLDKIRKHGADSLSKTEQKRLRELSE